MDWCLWYYFLTGIFYVTVIADNAHIRTIDVQQDERIRLECTVTSKFDVEEVCVEYSFSRLNAFHLYRR